MKTKQPLTPSDVPPGSVILFNDCGCPNAWVTPLIVDWSGITIRRGYGDICAISFNELMGGWKIKRPGQDWQPCYKEVETANPGELTAEEAELEYKRGNKIQHSWDDGKTWIDTLSCESGEPFTRRAKYRLKPAPIIRDIRPDELPERFIHSNEVKGFTVLNSKDFSAQDIDKWEKRGCKWSYDVRGPWREFTVTEEPK